MQVFIKVFSLNNLVEISIDTAANTFLYNSKVVLVDTIAFVTKLQHITGSWEKCMVDNSITDGFSYSVTYKTAKTTINYFGQNKLPENYSQFENLLSEVM